MAGRPVNAAKRRAFGAGVLPQSQRSAGVTMTAPVGGLNTVSPAGSMPPSDCLSLTNMIPFQYGLRVRAGYRDWFTGLRITDPITTNVVFQEVRTILPFVGAAENGSNDRLFVCTKDGIYDVTNPTNDITTFYDVTDAAYAFPMTSAKSGYGVATAFTNVAGEHFLAYTDGLNGYLLYRESTAAWEKIYETPDNPWVPGTAYAVGDLAVNRGLTYICTVPGTSAAWWLPSTDYAIGDKRVNGTNLYEVTSGGTSAAAGGPNTELTAGIIDNTVTWKFISLAGPIGYAEPSIDGSVTWEFSPTIAGADPSSFRFVMQWKNRLWFVPQDSQDAFYLEIGTFAGKAHKMIFAPRFRYGGDLVGLWSWTLDGGQGVDDLLVAISRGGDVAVYAGTNPAYAETFGLRGVWWIGPVPPGRSIASDFGGDLFVLSRAGCLPLSRLVAGGLIRDPNIYETAKINNLFNRLMSERGMFQGWGITQHPNDNLIVINVPGKSGTGPPMQLVMSLANKGWAQHEGLPISCMATWHGQFYFGAKDGRVCISTGYSDSGLYPVEVAGETTVWEYTDAGPQEIDFALLSAYQNLGSPNKKRVHMARPYFITDGTLPGYAVQARYDYDLTSVPTADMPVVGVVVGGWDVGLWDVAVWGSGAGTAGKQYGTAGMGSVIAIVLRGTAITNTTLVSIDVLLDSGWYL